MDTDKTTFEENPTDTGQAVEKQSTVSTDISKDAAVQKLVEEARKDEKEKLYAKLDKLSSENAQKSEELQTLRDQLSTFDSKFSKLSEAFVEKKEPTPEERAAATLSDIQKMRESLLAEKESFEREIRQAKLDVFKEKQMAKFGNELIPDMISGNTEDEILESVKRSNESYKAMKERIMEELASQEKEKRRGTKLPPNNVPSSEPAGVPEMDENAKKIQGMSLEEYEKQRDALLKLAQKL